MKHSQEESMLMSVKTDKQGFTLMELLISMAIATILMAAVYGVFEAMVKGQVSQESSLDMQQGARAALEIMAKEIRMAACDPTRLADAQILIADVGELQFTMDVANDAGDPRPDEDVLDGNENIRYALTSDANGDGIADGIAAESACDLGRDTGGGLQPFAENIDALNFVYLDGDGNVLAPPVAAANLEDIRSIEVTLVARSGQRLRGLLRTYRDTATYRNQQPGNAGNLFTANDNFRRLRLTTTVECRNNG